jgi:hypothetical protein
MGRRNAQAAAAAKMTVEARVFMAPIVQDNEELEKAKAFKIRNGREEAEANAQCRTSSE